MSLRRLSAIAAALLAAPLVVTVPTTAHAAPLPTTYGGATSGDILSLGLSIVDSIEVDAAVAHSATDVDSTAEPRSHAESANVSVGAVGLDVPVVSEEASSSAGGGGRLRRRPGQHQRPRCAGHRRVAGDGGHGVGG